jgi:hypothetical protein
VSDLAKFSSPAATDEVVCWDLDSTLRNTAQRWHLLPGRRPELYARDPGQVWRDYAKAAAEDTPMPGAVRLYKLLMAARHEKWPSRMYRMHICTGSDEVGREVADRWLYEQGLRYDDLRMRTPADRELDDGTSGFLKIRYTYALRALGLEPVLWVDDWPPDCEAIEAATGVPVLCADPKYPLGPDPMRWLEKEQRAYLAGYKDAAARVSPRVPEALQAAFLDEPTPREVAARF